MNKIPFLQRALSDHFFFRKKLEHNYSEGLLNVLSEERIQFLLDRNFDTLWSEAEAVCFWRNLDRNRLVQLHQLLELNLVAMAANCPIEVPVLNSIKTRLPSFC